MLLINNVKRWSTTYRKFYDLVHEQKISSDPQSTIFSKLLTQVKQHRPIVKYEAQKSLDFQLNRQSYQNAANQSTIGIEKIQYKNINLTLFSTSFLSKNLIPIVYKFLLKQKPDLIFAQIRPDSLLKNFKILKQKDGVFSNSAYVKQIIRNGFEVMPSKQQRTLVELQIKKFKLPLKILEQPFKSVYNTNTLISFTPFKSKQILNNQIIATIAYYSQRNQKSILLGHMPKLSERQWIVNSCTLMQLQQIFKNVIRQYVFNPQSKTQTIANFLYPEIMHHFSDRYMATLIQYLIAKKQYSNVVLFVGPLQSKSIIEYLQNRKVSTILSDLLPGPPKGSIIRDIENYQIIEKHCLLDVLQFGNNISKTSLQQLFTTNQMVQFYADPDAVDRTIKNKLQKFRVEIYNKYVKIYDEQFQLGQHQKKKQFIRSVL